MRSHARRWSLWVLCLLVLGCVPVWVASAGPARQDIPATYALTAENDQFQLYVDEATLAFKLVDKRSEYVWHSGIDAPLEGDRLNRSWQAFALSGLTIDFLDARAVDDRASLSNAEHTIEITPVEQGISAQVTFTEPGITVGLVLQLEDEGVRVELPFAAIREDNPSYRLGQIIAYPFLGATRGSSTPGYMFLPDGTGSLIEFADTTRARNMFFGRYYGPDFGMLAVQPYDPFRADSLPISFPVFGMVHGEGEHAFWSVVERGAAYGELQAHPAGVITNFNFAYSAFIYNEPYFQATNLSGAGVSTVQRRPNTFDAVVHYRFLTGDEASYVGMARDYRAYLLAHGALHQNDFTNPDIGMRLEFLGGDKEPALLAQRFVPMTTIGQMRDILAALQIPNPEVVYFGWQPLGATAMPPTTLAVDGALGSVSDLTALAGEIAAEGGRFSLYLEAQAAFVNEPGYSARNDLAMAITDTSIEGWNRYPMGFFSRNVLEERTRALASSVSQQPNVGLALDGIGWRVYGDFRNGQELSREDAIRIYQELLAQLPLPLAFYRPNDYVFGLAQAYYDMPLGDNGYIFTTRAVPFLPIVLSGAVPMYGGPFNYSSDRQGDLLKHAEYGMYPSYFLTSAPTSDMIDTLSVFNIYSSAYDQWGDRVRETYAWLNALLGPVRGQEIVDHTMLADEVFVTTYAGGARIVVNYADEPFALEGITVPARDAILLEAGS